ncbi:MAG: serine/threonine protein kinase, partial [Cyanobium sp.]
MSDATVSPGHLIGARYRLERQLGSGGNAPVGAAAQGSLWLGRDQLAADAPCALRQIGPGADQERARDIWSRLQGLLHPQVPRLGPALVEGDQLWLVREWQAGRTYGQMRAARAERQMVFGAGEVLLLLRQLLPVLAALHSQELLHGDLSPDNLLRRDSDGLPVLLDFGLVRGTAAGEGAIGPLGATPGYAPPELLRGEPAQPWMDLHALGVVALVLLSGDAPEALLDPVTLEWRWPVSLDAEAPLKGQLQRLVERDPARRFASAGQALVAFQALEMPESTGPVPRADRTVMLVPPEAPPRDPGPSEVLEAPERETVASAATAVPGSDAASAADPQPGEAADPADRAGAPSPAPPSAAPPPPLTPALLARQREEAAEGGLWPVLAALVISAVVGTALGWWWLGGGRVATSSGGATSEQPATLPPGEVDQRQQLLDRLRALQVDRGWFLRLVNASLLAQYPERRGRLPSDSLEDAPLRRVWNDLAEEWLARVEQLPLSLRQRLGSIQQSDWDQRRQSLERQGLAEPVLRHLVSASARGLLPGRSGEDMPEEPFRQLWYAAADQLLESLRIEPIQAGSGAEQLLAADVPAGGARLFVIRLPAGHGLALGVGGTPLLQMSVYAADGTLLEAKGPLRVVTLGAQPTSPVQLLVTNEGVAPAMIRLSLR